MKTTIIFFLTVLFLLACEEVINEENISDEQVIVLAPTQNSKLKTNTQINYNWQALAGATSYELQIATPNFAQANQILVDSLVSAPLFVKDSLQIGDYEWRVRALNEAFATGYTTNSFTVEK